MTPTLSEPGYTVRTYTGPPLPCAECKRDIKALGFHFGLSAVEYDTPHYKPVFCDYLCLGWYGLRWARRRKAASS